MQKHRNLANNLEEELAQFIMLLLLMKKLPKHAKTLQLCRCNKREHFLFEELIRLEAWVNERYLVPGGRKNT
jgi:hypothetical protein